MFSWFSIVSPYCFIITCTGIDSLLGLPCCFKNINDVEKAIEDHTLATNSSSSVYKMEHGFNAKGIYIYEFVLFASYIFCTNIFFFS